MERLRMALHNKQRAPFLNCLLYQQVIQATRWMSFSDSSQPVDLRSFADRPCDGVNDAMLA